MTPPIQEPHQGLNAAVAAEIRAEQGRRKISVQALAEKSGIPYGSLRRYLNAERHIDVAVLNEICLAFGMEPGELVHQAALRIDTAWPTVDVELKEKTAGELAGRAYPEVQAEAARHEDD